MRRFLVYRILINALAGIQLTAKKPIMLRHLRAIAYNRGSYFCGA
jgi:hypothetical protein